MQKCTGNEAPMNWDDMKLFLATDRTGSISGGAWQPGVQHSTISRRMRQLEAKLDARLIDQYAKKK